MKKILNNKYLLITMAIVVGVVVGWLIKPSANEPIAQSEHQHTSTPDTWTCSMHPQIRQNEPGQCPICGMELIPMDNNGNDTIDPESIAMSETAMILAGVRTSIVSKSNADKTIRLNGKIAYDETNISKIPAHFHGRIEQLYINYTGEVVKKGQLLAEVYSPELVTAQKELLVAAKKKDVNPRLYESARIKLKNWKISNSELARVEKSGEPITNLKIHTHKSGVVTKRLVAQGDHVQMGDILFEVADIKNLWILFDVYEADMSWINEGDKVAYNIPSLPGVAFEGTVSYIDPVIDPKTRVAKARVEVRNPTGKLKPEMFVSGQVKSLLEANVNAMAIPKSAVMWTGKRSVVYVKDQSDKGISFKMREIILGPALGEAYVVKEGLQPGEEIATSGTFSIDAAAQLAGKPSMMSPEGGAAMTGHNHTPLPDEETSTTAKEMENTKTETTFDVDPKFKSQIKSVYKAYLPLKDVLVASDAPKVQEEAKKLMNQLNEVEMELLKGDAHHKWMEYLTPLQKAIEKMTSNTDLVMQREALIPLTNNLLNSIRTFKVTGIEGYYQFCPMANNNNGAYWLSAADDVKNPYFGDAMLSCGEVIEKID